MFDSQVVGFARVDVVDGDAVLADVVAADDPPMRARPTRVGPVTETVNGPCSFGA